MPLSLVQQGLIAQQEFAKLLMMGSDGRIEVASPLTDDERRDYEIHVRGQYDLGLAIQVKSTLRLDQASGQRARYLRISFRARATRLVSHPLYWYAIAALDPKLMRFADPLFVIPSTEFHEHASPRRIGAFWHFTFAANMEAETHDRWRPFRVDPLQLGGRVMEIMAEVRRQRHLEKPPGELLAMLDPVWIRPTTRPTRAHHARRAA
jgi:hypothetical protein